MAGMAIFAQMEKPIVDAGLLAAVVGAVEAEGEALRAEFCRPGGPRGRRGTCPLDREIEERLRTKLCGLISCQFVGEEGEASSGPQAGWTWLVDPHDGTFEFMSGRRGSAISVALLREGVPVLGVVHAPDPPDRGPDTIAWAEGARLQRDGRPLEVDLSQRRLAAGEFVLATASTALKPETWSRAVAPARYVAMPSIAYRLARVAAGDAIATLSVHGVAEYDVAAGMALLRAARGVLLDAEGREVALQGRSENRLSGCFAGAPQAARQLAQFDWKLLDQEPRREPRVTLVFPRRKPDTSLSRAQGCLLGQVVGDSLGSQVEFKPANEIARLHPGGLRELADGGVYHMLAGQPTDDSEMALTLARAIAREGRYDAEKVLDRYREWLTSRPVDVGMTTEKGLIGIRDSRSESNGSLMRVSPIGIWAAGDPALPPRTPRAPRLLAHPPERRLPRGLRRLLRGDRRRHRRREPGRDGRGRARAFEGPGARGDQARRQGQCAGRLLHPPGLGHPGIAERFSQAHPFQEPRRSSRRNRRLRRRHRHQRRHCRGFTGFSSWKRKHPGALDLRGALVPAARRVRRAAAAPDRVLARRRAGACRSAARLEIGVRARFPTAIAEVPEIGL
jgi:fructose-1,6-bisphosphatase/inositol monophosphatase family enzyme